MPFDERESPLPRAASRRENQNARRRDQLCRVRYAVPVHRTRAGILYREKLEPAEALQSLPRLTPRKLWWRRQRRGRRRTPAVRDYMRPVRQNRFSAFQAFERQTRAVRRVFCRKSCSVAARKIQRELIGRHRRIENLFIYPLGH